MSAYCKKIISLSLAISSAFWPLVSLAQPVADPNAYGNFLNQNRNSSVSAIPGLQQVLDGYTGGGQGSGFLQQIMGDQKSCQAEAPQAQNPQQQSALGQGLSQGMVEAAGQAIQQNLGGQLQQAVGADLPQRLQNNIQTQLPQVFRSNLQNQINQGLNPQTIDQNLVQQILKDSLNQITKQTVNDSVANSLPGAINNSLNSGLADALPSVLRSSLQNSLSGPLNNAIFSSLNGSSNISDTLINQVLGNLSNQLTNTVMSQLGGSLDGITSSITDGIMSNLDSSLNQIVGSANGSLNSVLGNLTGSVNQITNSLTGALTNPLNDLTSGLTTSLDGLVNGLTSPLTNLSSSLTGSLNNLTSGLTSSLTKPLNQITQSLTGSLSGITNQLTSAITGPISQLTDGLSSQLSGIVGQVTKPITDIIGNATGGLTDNLLGGLTGGILGGGGGLLGGLGGGLLSSSVPVHEVGDLLNVTKEIKGIEDDSKKVLIEICGHIKDVRRVQLAMEQKEFVQDPQARDSANNLTSDYTEQYYNYLNTGHAAGAGGEKDSFVIQNYGDYLQSKRNEAARIALDTDLKNSGDIFKDATREILTKQEASARNYPASTISKADYDKLQNPGQISSSDYTKLLTQVYDPTKPNNPLTSYIINNEVLQNAKDRAEQLAITESQSTGFKPVEECVEKASDGQTCLKWKIITPSSIVEHQTGTVLDTKVNQLEQVHEVSDLSQDTPTPSVQETQTLKPTDSKAGGNSGFNSGFMSNAFSTLLNSLRGIFNGGLNLPGTGGGNNNGGGNTGGGGNLTANLSFTSASVDEILAGEANNAFLNLQTTGASQCTANNDWLSLKASGNKFEVIKAAGASVGTSGSITLHYPLTFDANLTRTRAGATTELPAESIINPGLTQQVTAMAVAASEIAAGDQFTLSLKNGNEPVQSVSVTLTSGSAYALNTALQTAINNLSSGSETAKLFSYLRLTFGVNPEGTSFITMTIDPTYKLTCTNGTNSVDKTVTITR